MKRPIQSLWLLAVLLAGLGLAACGATPAAVPTPAPSPQPTEKAAGVTVVDALGRTVEFAAPPERIVVAGKAGLTILDSLYLFPEAAQRVVGFVTGKQK